MEVYKELLVQLRQLNPNDFKQNEDIAMYVKVYVASVILFYMVYLSCHFVMSKIIQFKLYNELSSYDQADYLSRITAQVHALISSVISYYLMFYSCGDGKTYFNSDECFYNPTQLTISLLCISFGYISFDLIIILKDIQDFSSLGMQNIVHHIISMTASFTALMVGGFNISAASATAFTEVSTIFLHIRYYMIKAKYASGKPFLIVVLIFIGLFVYARLYLQVFVAMRMKEGFDREFDNILKR